MKSLCRSLVGFAVSTLVLACAGEQNTNTLSGSTTSVTGHWCGATAATSAKCLGDEVEYLELTQTGNSVTGIACEAYQKDCYAVQSGLFESGALSYYYTFDSFRVDADLTLTNGTLTGSYHSDKCDCDVPLTFHSVP